MRNLLFTLALTPAVLAASVAHPAAAQDTRDEPGTFATPAVVSPNWAFDLEVSTPRPISVKDAHGRTVWYWYAAYKVTNNTGEDRRFIPEVTLTDNNGRIVQAGRRIPSNVFPAIDDKLGNPLLENPNNVVGRLLQGDDFAKESVAIWPASPQDVDEFTLFFAGADGEVKELLSPKTGQPILQAAVDPITNQPVLDADGNAVMRPVLVRRTRAYAYTTPGTRNAHGSLQEQPVGLIEETVVMR